MLSLFSNNFDPKMCSEEKHEEVDEEKIITYLKVIIEHFEN